MQRSVVLAVPTLFSPFSRTPSGGVGVGGGIGVRCVIVRRILGGRVTFRTVTHGITRWGSQVPLLVGLMKRWGITKRPMETGVQVAGWTRRYGTGIKQGGWGWPHGRTNMAVVPVLPVMMPLVRITSVPGRGPRNAARARPRAGRFVIRRPRERRNAVPGAHVS
jgi:hypothetical protein